MKALQVVDLNNTSFSSFPSSLSCLTNLRVLFLGGPYNGYTYNDTDLLISSLTNLEILSIRGVIIPLFPTEMGNLARLRYLDLRGFRELIMPLNVLSKLSNLEELYMTNSFDDWQVQQDTGTSTGCTSAPPGPNRSAFVELARLTSLTHLFVEVRSKEFFSQEFDSVDPWPNLIEFHIIVREYGINIRDFFDVGIKAALWLKRGNYNALLPGWLKRLMTRTKQLALYDWETLDIPASNFSLVEDLIINGTGNSSMLFNAGESFTNLKRLKVSDCCNITGIFASDTLLPKVERIELYCLPQLTRICQEGDLRCPNLTRLVVDECNSLTHIFCRRDGVLFPNLRELIVEKCKRLTAIIASSEELEEEETTMLQQDNSFLPRLQKHRLIRLPLLTKFHQAGNIHNNTPRVFILSVRDLFVEDCPQLEALHLGPESLTNISIDNSSNLCNSLSSSDFFSRAPLLEYLKLVGIKELYEIFFGMGVLTPAMYLH